MECDELCEWPDVRLRQPDSPSPHPANSRFKTWNWAYSFTTASTPYGSSRISSASEFSPTELNAEQWVLAAKGMGSEVCGTHGRHEARLLLWPTATTEYSIRSSPYKDGKGDIVREFVDACSKQA